MTTEVVRKLDRLLNPRSVAVVGDKRQTNYMWLHSMSTFQGRVYSVQVDRREVEGIEAMGVPNYASLLEIPGEVDYVLVAVPRAVAPRIVGDCIAKGVGGCTLFTSGFAETGQEEGVRLQEELRRMAVAAGLALVGPNCMGVYNPRLGLRHSPDQPAGESGNVGFISQSGTHATFFSLVGARQGVRISKSVSFGNAVVLDVSDYLEYMAQDGETEVIAMYVEGVRDGRRFLRTLRETAKRKPVVVWKGGQTEAGHRAIYSHTASLASGTAVWEAAMRQCGAVSVDSLDEAIDAVKALLYARAGTGKRMGLIAMTGGQSVIITDAFARAGLAVLPLTDASYERLADFFNVIGGSYRNPLDAGGTIAMGGEPLNLQRLLDILDEDENVDAMALEVSVGFLARRWQQDPALLDRMLGIIADLRAQSAKPLVVIVQPLHLEALAAEVRSRVQGLDVPAFGGFQQAALALRRAIDYGRFRAGMD
ncbi:MAG: CoA-binding protein [Dehalococcoidia bacterium]